MKLWDKVTGKKEEKKLEMPEKVEAVQITEESLKSEIETSVSDFKNEDKKVIIPTPWFGSGFNHDTRDIYPENWLKQNI